MPNLIQTLENTPAIVHGGPFPDIADGATRSRRCSLARRRVGQCGTDRVKKASGKPLTANLIFVADDRQHHRR